MLTTQAWVVSLLFSLTLLTSLVLGGGGRYDVPPVDLSIQRRIVCHGGAAVGKLVHFDGNRCMWHDAVIHYVFLVFVD